MRPPLGFDLRDGRVGHRPCGCAPLRDKADQAGLTLRGVRVSADGDFDRETWRSTGIVFRVQVDADATQHEVDELIRRVDAVAEIPRTLRQETAVQRRG